MQSEPHRAADSDRALAQAMAHPVRGKVLMALNDHPGLSAQEIASRLGEQVDSIRYHLRMLVRDELVEESGKKARRGVIERFYRPIRRPFVSDEAFAHLDEVTKWKIAMEVIKAIFSDASRSLTERSIHKRGHHLTRLKFAADQKGWIEMLALYQSSLDELERIKAECQERLQGGGERFWVTSGLLLFESSSLGSGDSDS